RATTHRRAAAREAEKGAGPGGRRVREVSANISVTCPRRWLAGIRLVPACAGGRRSLVFREPPGHGEADGKIGRAREATAPSRCATSGDDLRCARRAGALVGGRGAG